MDEFNHPTPHTGGWHRRGTTIILEDPFAADLQQTETGPGGGAAPPRPRKPSQDQLDLLKSFFGSDEVGARARMGNFWVPPGLKRSTLLWYAGIARRALADPVKATPRARLVQPLRLQLIGRALRGGGLDPELQAGFESFGTRRPRIAELVEETVPGPCPDVPVPPSRRPKLLQWGSEPHSAVREIQRKLNAFHAYRVAARLPGLADAPLGEDCIVGRHTHNGVESFQKLVFPGVAEEHDGKVGSHTWAQLDAIAVGPSGTAQLTVEQVSFVGSAGSGPLGWDQVIGLETPTINVELFASGLPAATMPAQIGVKLASRPPNLTSGAATWATPVSWALTRIGADRANPARQLYRASGPLSDASASPGINEVASVVRPGGTSDAEFRKALGVTCRGIATQPARKIEGSTKWVSTGSEATEIPDAMALFRAGGVEVLELSVPARPNWRVASKASKVKRLVRSPADVLYYSGHGLSSGNLVIDPQGRPCPTTVRGSYDDWLRPADLTQVLHGQPVWHRHMALDVLILAGCSVLKIDFSASRPTGPGLAWASLLIAKGGPLVALLGYQRLAPCDSPVGNAIAKAMAARMAAGSTNYARDWLTINGSREATNAVAMDGQGYWWLEPLISTRWGGLSYQIKGPRTIP